MDLIKSKCEGGRDGKEKFWKKSARKGQLDRQSFDLVASDKQRVGSAI